MSSYVVTGKLGSGKTIVAVGRIFEYLLKGRPVATNLDIHLDKYLSPESRRSIIRIPDKPTAADMEAIGKGNDTADEANNGLLVLDELGSWLNTRSWQDKERRPLLDWFIHARKLGWDLILIVQSIDMIDAQLRGMLAEHLVICRRLDRLKVPFVSGITKMVGVKTTLPKIHIGKVHYGETVNDMVVDRWIYTGKQFYNAYDTRQCFSPYYDKGVYSVLSPWHTVGRYLPEKQTLWERVDTVMEAIFNPPRPYFDLKPKHPLVERIMRLPDPAMRLDFYRRFQAVGAI